MPWTRSQQRERISVVHKTYLRRLALGDVRLSTLLGCFGLGNIAQRAADTADLFPERLVPWLLLHAGITELTDEPSSS